MGLSRGAFIITVIIGSVLAGAPPALAVVPPNDDVADATVIQSIPFTDSVDNADATIEEGERQALECFITRTVWYAYTPDETGFLDANTFGSDFNTQLTVYASTGGSVCNDDVLGGNAGSLQSQVVFEAVAGTTYLFQVGGCCNEQSTLSGTIVFNLSRSEGPSQLEDIALDGATIDPRTRMVTVTGTVTCSDGVPKRVAVEVIARQRRGQQGTTGAGATTLTCDGETPWTTVFEANEGRFRPGRASFEISAFDNDVDFISEETTALIRVKP